MDNQAEELQSIELEQPILGVELEASTELPEDEPAQPVESGEEEEIIVSIGEGSPPEDEEEPERAAEWVRELRKANREDKKRIRELEEKLNAVAGAEQKPEPLGAKPTLEDHDYDAEAFEADLARWFEKKRQHDEAQAKAEAERQSAQQQWQTKVDSYNQAKSALKVKDFEGAEMTVQEVMSTTQQGILLQGAENPALLVYAIGKNPQEAKKLAAIQDPVQFAVAIGKLEMQLKVTNKKTAPPPEKTVAKGGAGIAGAVDSQLERLRAEAEKTGDYTKVTAYRRQNRK